MCGIAGFVDLSVSMGTDAMTGTIYRMLNSIRHRGPDDCGIWIDSCKKIALGHRRLSIIDVSKNGSQPMCSSSGRFHIVFNGEIYNHHVLRKKLIKIGCIFNGSSDTEVLLTAIEKWGVDTTLQLIVGMFSFALWDDKKQDLHLVRDRMGEKPLYYGWINNYFIFSSELKAMQKHPVWSGDINHDALALYMRYGYIPDPFSIYKNVYKVEAGSILSISTNYKQKLNTTISSPVKYWDIKNIAENGVAHQLDNDETEVISSLDELLKTSIKQQMIADVPLGAFLSGGIDSSTVVALMQIQSDLPVKTFTIGFEEKDFNEAVQAKSVANYLGTDHTEIYITPMKAMDVIKKIPEIYDEPFSDSSQIPTYLVSELARKDVTVCLTGDGGDELFGGYNRYLWTVDVWNNIKWLPVPIRRMIESIIVTLTPHQWDCFYKMISAIFRINNMQRSVGSKLHKFSQVISSRNVIEMYNNLISYWKDPSALVIGGNDPGIYYSSKDQLVNSSNFIDSMMYWDCAYYLPNDNLVKVDRAGMAVSLETRLPLLDHRIVEFAWKVPLSMKIKNGQGKWLLRQVLYKYVPRELIERPKTGFSVPIGEWLRGPMREWAEGHLSEKRLSDEGFFNPLLVREKWKEHLSGKRNWQSALWTVLMFQAWYAENKKILIV